MKVLAHKLLMCLYVGLFSYELSLSIRKWFLGRTKYVSNVVDVEKIQYPSMSICKRVTFNGKEILPKLFENGSLAYKKKLAMENIWSKSEVFHFVSHPGMFGMAYPCVTTNDGSDPGKPCYFPFRYNYIFFR